MCWPIIFYYTFCGCEKGYVAYDGGDPLHEHWQKILWTVKDKHAAHDCVDGKRYPLRTVSYYGLRCMRAMHVYPDERPCFRDFQGMMTRDVKFRRGEYPDKPYPKGDYQGNTHNKGVDEMKRKNGASATEKAPEEISGPNQLTTVRHGNDSISPFRHRPRRSLSAPALLLKQSVVPSITKKAPVLEPTLLDPLTQLIVKLPGMENAILPQYSAAPKSNSYTLSRYPLVQAEDSMEDSQSVPKMKAGNALATLQNHQTQKTSTLRPVAAPFVPGQQWVAMPVSLRTTSTPDLGTIRSYNDQKLIFFAPVQVQHVPTSSKCTGISYEYKLKS